VGEALVGLRQQAVIATKVALDWDNEGKIVRNSTPTRIRAEIEDSLRRLRTDYIDLYQVHWPDSLVSIEETAAELEKLRQQGKILAIGVSNFSVEQMQQFASVAKLSTLQPPYNLFERGAEYDLFPYAQQNNLVVLAYGALCRGLLSGRMHSGTTFAEDDLRSFDPKFQSPRFAQYLAAVQELTQLARDRFGKSMLALAVRWVLDNGPTIALWGARRPDQLRGVDEAYGWKLSAKDIADIDAILAKHIPQPIGPEFMAPPHR